MKHKALYTLLLSTLIGCSSSKDLGSTGTEATCSETNDCLFSAKMMDDSFERKQALVNTTEEADELTFWWRKIINDQGKVVAGSPGNNVDVRIFSSQELGPGSSGGSALYFFGRAGRSVHNIYLVSQTFDLRAAKSVALSFQHLAIDLEANEYLKLEVCRGSLEDCGVGEKIDVSGLNSQFWQPLFELYGETGTALNGRNHTASDWVPEKIEIPIDSTDLRTFTFRFHARMNDGFANNDPSKNLEDAIGLDDIKATAFRTFGKSSDQNSLNEVSDNPIVGTVNPFDPRQSFDPDDPRLFQ